jgi:tRNA pseudouridine38-40 synthase
MHHYKIIIAYAGTDFCGWQIQPQAESVTSCMQKAYKKVFGHDIILLGASRTDSGVHAMGQVGLFKTDLNIDPQIILDSWNAMLPKSISIRSIQEVDESFHPCKNVLQKTYYYTLFFTRPLPFVSRFGWHYKFIKKVDLEKFEKCLQLYVGEHNFASFCKIEDEKKSPIRKIDSINLIRMPKPNVLQIVIKGKSFLRFQIRRMVGYALDVARRPDLSIDYLRNILDNPNPCQTLVKAEGCGLCLRKVVYKNDRVIKK